MRSRTLRRIVIAAAALGGAVLILMMATDVTLDFVPWIAPGIFCLMAAPIDNTPLVILFLICGVLVNAGLYAALAGFIATILAQFRGGITPDDEKGQNNR